jgi:hypothetical protein
MPRPGRRLSGYVKYFRLPREKPHYLVSALDHFMEGRVQLQASFHPGFWANAAVYRFLSLGVAAVPRFALPVRPLDGPISAPSLRCPARYSVWACLGSVYSHLEFMLGHGTEGGRSGRNKILSGICSLTVAKEMQEPTKLPSPAQGPSAGARSGSADTRFRGD